MRNLECLQNTADDYQELWLETEPDLPWLQIKTMIVEVITHHPQVLAIATNPRLASNAMLAIDPDTAPPDVDVGHITGIINSGLAYVRARCPEIITTDDHKISTSSTPLLSWPKGE